MNGQLKKMMMMKVIDICIEARDLQILLFNFHIFHTVRFFVLFHTHNEEFYENLFHDNKSMEKFSFLVSRTLMWKLKKFTLSFLRKKIRQINYLVRISFSRNFWKKKKKECAFGFFRQFDEENQVFLAKKIQILCNTLYVQYVIISF